jgi:hypothetical protein
MARPLQHGMSRADSTITQNCAHRLVLEQGGRAVVNQALAQREPKWRTHRPALSILIRPRDLRQSSKRLIGLRRMELTQRVKMTIQELLIRGTLVASALKVLLDAMES